MNSTSTSRQKHPLLVRAIHWVAALFIFGLLASGVVMVRLTDDNPSKYEVFYVWHQSFGILALALVNLRLLVRLRTTLLPLPQSLSSTVRKTAAWCYGVMYLLMLAIPIAGFIMSAAYPDGQGVPFFGITLPSFISPDKTVYSAAQLIHWTMAYGFAALIAIHIAAALKHRWFDLPEHDVLKRMV